MSNYTTELRFVCETFAGLTESEGYNSINTIIDKARPMIFNFYYPIFDEAYRPTLETKIIKHYYTRELCAETYARWKLFLDARLNEIMPKYNQLYESELLKFNPLWDTDYNREGDVDELNSTDDNEVRTTDMTSLQTDDRKSVDTLSGTDTENITTTLSGNDRVAGTDTLSGSDRTAGTDTLSGSDATTTIVRQGGSDTTERENEPITDQWTYYNDTPQGGVDGMTLGNNTYLTNATHVTQTGEGSHDESTTRYGKTTSSTATTTYGKVDSKDMTTTYGKVDSSDTTTTYGKVSTTEDEMEYGKVDTRKDTGTTKNETDGSVTSNRDINSTNNKDYAEHVFGKMPGKSYSKLLQEFRDTFLNIDLMIIRELSDLFFGLWE